MEEETGTPHNDESKKNSIVAIVYDEKQDKYLTINWGNNGGRLFVGGTIKENESSLECAIREIAEETGYTDISLVKTAFKINHHYYAYNKDKYFNIQATPFLFTLNSDKMVSQNLDDDEKFQVEWVSKDIIQKEIVDELHKKSFEYTVNETAMVGDGIHINSDVLDGLHKEEAISKMISYLEEKGIGRKKTNYKLQDWIFTRQRFWGEPIPLIYCDDCGTGTYHAELCGGTAYKDRSADVNFPGSAWKDRVWQISCHGRSFLHCNDRCCADTVIFIHLWFCAARRKLCGGFGILAVWLRMYCDRYADVSGNGKSGYRSSAWICSTVSWLHDVEYYQHDLTER